MQRFKYVLYVIGGLCTLPATLVFGILLALGAILGQMGAVRRDKFVLCWYVRKDSLLDRLFEKVGLGGITLGLNVLMDAPRVGDLPELEQHEEWHVAQNCAINPLGILGILLIWSWWALPLIFLFELLYYFDSLIAWGTGNGIYTGNHFEMQASREQKEDPI